MLLRRRVWRRPPAATLKRAGLRTFGRRFWDDETATAQAHTLATVLAVAAVMMIASCF
jgi:hypothetical protein